MRRNWLLILGVVLVLLGAGGVILRGRLNPAQAGIQVETSPQATVVIDDEQAGLTPYKGTLPPGEITLRLVPQAENGPLSTYQTKLTLTAGINTVVKRDFGKTDEVSSGEVLSFEKIAGNSASLAVVSSPDASQISIDGQVRGFTPMKLETITVGEHEITVSTPGYSNRTISARAEAGYKLTVIASLARSEETGPEGLEPAGEDEQLLKPRQTLVEILDTPTGWLRVRMGPSTAATESAKVDVSKKFPFLEENDDSTWFKIEYESGRKGWVSAQYARKVPQ